MDRKSSKKTFPDDEFAQTVMRWSSDQIVGGPVESLPELDMFYPSSASEMSACYKRLLKLILEDSRAAIAQGYDAEEWKETEIVVRSVKAPQNPSHPWNFDVQGKLEAEKTETMIMKSVISLGRVDSKGNTFSTLLGYATQVFDSPSKFTVLIYVSKDFFGSTPPKKGEVWRATYLASVLSHARMYQAVQTLSKAAPSSLAQSILSARLPPYPSVSSDPMVGLNRSQSCAVRTFLHPQAQMVVLQGPPGTGKTTTIATILKKLAGAGQRTLVCAPSNKAVEVLAARFYKDEPDRCMLLVGAEGKIKDHLVAISSKGIIKDVAEHLQNAAGKLETALSLANEPLHKLYKHNEISAHCESAKRSLGAALTPLRKFRLVNEHDTIAAAYEKILAAEADDLSRSALRAIAHLPGLLRSLGVSEEDLINNAGVIFCTLSVSGRGMMLKMDPPVALIVDEAGQSVEAETLIALQHNPSKMLLVGDTKQLPATVMSTFAKEKHYGWSMMERLVDKCNVPALMLDEQYRMHPSISAWPSTRYYRGKLRDGANIPMRERPSTCPQWLHPLAFYDMPRNKNKEVKVGKSTANKKEAVYVARILQLLRQTDQTSTVGIIAPYAAQVQFIEKELKYRNVSMLNTRVSTVDSFQGDECDYIFISFTRSRGGVGFAGDAQRLNVAVTRAKHALLMVGSAFTLKNTPEFSSMFAHLNVSESFFNQSRLDQILSTMVKSDSTKKTHSGTGKTGPPTTATKELSPTAPSGPGTPVDRTRLRAPLSTSGDAQVRETERASSTRANDRIASPSRLRAPQHALNPPVLARHAQAGEVPRTGSGNRDVPTATRAASVPAHPIIPPAREVPHSNLAECFFKFCGIFGFRMHAYHSV